ncbi:hypothetical protein DH2020_043182 [Rehmannia glutinosa]|uniref:Uncharacterized protein n=1 Tax=Rehmannia glutinosa TaxID=99300 RepID=A0ABR0UKF0_REHGL
MEQIPTVVYHNGQWGENGEYRNFEITGILIPMDNTFNTLREILEQQIQYKKDVEAMHIRYKLTETLPPLKIESDYNLKFYLEVKNKETDWMKFPLCIDIQNVTEGTSNMSIESSLKENMGQNAIGYIDYANLISRNVVGEEDTMEIQEITHAEEQFQKGDVYNTKEELIKQLICYALKHHFQYKVKRSCKQKYYVNCIDENCNWHLKASSTSGTKTFIVREHERTHTCPLDKRMSDNRHATTKIVGDLIKSKYLNNIKTVYTPTDIIRDMKDEHGISLDYKKAWRSKEKALEIIRGKSDESYQKLPAYLYMLEETNLGSITEIVRKEDDTFLFLFMAISASIKGWRHCRPVIVVDGTFLKTSYGGTLLSARTQDGNESILSLAFSVVDSENDGSWVWFFTKIRQTFGLREGMCIVSNRHVSIETTINEVQNVKFFFI